MVHGVATPACARDHSQRVRVRQRAHTREARLHDEARAREVHVEEDAARTLLLVGGRRVDRVGGREGLRVAARRARRVARGRHASSRRRCELLADWLQFYYAATARVSSTECFP